MDSLAQYRLNNAVEKLESAKLLLDAGIWKDRRLSGVRKESKIQADSIYLVENILVDEFLKIVDNKQEVGYNKRKMTGW